MRLTLRAVAVLCLAACGGELTPLEADVARSPLEGAKRVFVTSAVYPAGRLGGLLGADSKCQAHAQSAGLPGVYKAWLSTEAASPSTRFTRATVPYVRVDGVRVADSYQALVTRSSQGLASGEWLLAPLNVTETGGLAPKSPVNRYGYSWGSVAFTGTRQDGTRYPNRKFCNGWTAVAADTTPPTDGPHGGSTEPNNVTSKGASWSDHFSSGPGLCDGQAPLYCFEQ